VFRAVPRGFGLPLPSGHRHPGDEVLSHEPRRTSLNICVPAYHAADFGRYRKPGSSSDFAYYHAVG
jgi:hypothetical protein